MKIRYVRQVEKELPFVEVKELIWEENDEKRKILMNYHKIKNISVF